MFKPINVSYTFFAMRYSFVPILITGNDLPRYFIASVEALMIISHVFLPQFSFFKIIFIVFPHFGRVFHPFGKPFMLFFRRNMEIKFEDMCLVMSPPVIFQNH